MATRPWLPTDLSSGLVAWWDASDLTGTAVSAWRDKVGGLTLSQAAGAAQPTFNATARNGKPGVVFSGAQSLSNATVGSLPVGTNASSVLVSGYIVPGAATSAAFLWGDFTNNGCARLIGAFGTGNGSFVLETTLGDNYPAAQTWSSVDHCVIAQISSASPAVIQINVDGGSDQTRNSNITINTTTGQGTQMGATAGSRYLTGTIQQVTVVNRTLSVSERQQFEGWESWYTGKNGSNLPANHPYKAAAPTVTTGGIIIPRRRPLLLMAS